jgi:hypothetical protein
MEMVAGCIEIPGQAILVLSLRCRRFASYVQDTDPMDEAGVRMYGGLKEDMFHLIHV